MTRGGRGKVAGSRRVHRARRRGFTVVELLLAAALGAMVVMASMTLFAAISRTERRTAVRDFGQQELSRLNAAIRKATSQIVVLGFAPRPAPPTPPAVALPEGVEPAEPEEPGTYPRLILETDTMTGMQRMELVVAEPPVLGGADGVALEADAGKRFSMTRGAFVVRPSIGTLPDDVMREVLPGTPLFDVWWVPVDRKEEGLAPVGRAEGVIVARGLTELRWRFFKSDENRQLQALTSAKVTARSELPAYFEMDVATVQGHKGKWMFEVGWTVQAVDPLTNSARDRDGRGRRGSEIPGVPGTSEPFPPIDSTPGRPAGGGGTRGGGRILDGGSPK